MQTGLSERLHSFTEATASIIESTGSSLSKHFGITHFGHIKFDKNGRMLRLSNNRAWSEIFYKEAFYNDDKMYDLSWVPIGERKRKFLLGKPTTPHEKSLFENNLWNFLLIYERTESSGCFTFFGTDKNNTAVVDYYLNHYEAFDHFILFFKEKTFPFLEMKEDRCIQLNINPIRRKPDDRDSAIKSFYKETKISKFYLDSLFENLVLSKKEAETLYYLSEGRSIKRIADILHLSPKAIESRVNSIKIKINAKNKDDIINKFYKIKSCLL